MKIINLTPHPCVILREDPQGDIEGVEGVGSEVRRYRKIAELPPSGKVARASQKEEIAGFILVNDVEVPVVRMTYGEPINLPEPKEGVVYFVSLLTAQAAAATGRRTDDLVFAGKTVRSKEGSIIGITSFGKL